MAGDKPDPRLRTPMHWELGPAAGFTDGAPWEALQADSLTANVTELTDDPGSILNLHRELIHLRASHPALGIGELIPLESSAPGTVAWLRTRGDAVALVVANLTEEPLAGVALSSGDGGLPAGTHAPRLLWGEGEVAEVNVTGEGTLDGYVPLASLAPLQAYVIDVMGPASR